jgi:hypothetical protein
MPSDDGDSDVKGISKTRSEGGSRSYHVYFVVILFVAVEIGPLVVTTTE